MTTSEQIVQQCLDRIHELDAEKLKLEKVVEILAPHKLLIRAKVRKRKHLTATRRTVSLGCARTTPLRRAGRSHSPRDALSATNDCRPRRRLASPGCTSPRANP